MKPTNSFQHFTVVRKICWS